MAQRHKQFAPVGQYTPYPITSVISTLTGIGHCVATTAPGPISVGVQVVTPASMVGIVEGLMLNVGDGAASEDVRVIAVTSTTFTALFLQAHSGSVNLTSRNGTFLGGLVIGSVGSGVTIEIHNGHPNLNPAPTHPSYGLISTITPVAPFVPFPAVLDFGLYIKVAGTVGNYTLLYDDMI